MYRGVRASGGWSLARDKEEQLFLLRKTWRREGALMDSNKAKIVDLFKMLAEIHEFVVHR